MNRVTATAVFVTATLIGSWQAASAASLPTFSSLEQQAKTRATATTARVPMAEPGDPVFAGIETLETGGRVPNYLRALAVKPTVVKPFAHLFKTFVYGGSVRPALKLAMATRMAQVNGSAYGVAYLSRLLHASDGDALLAAIRAEKLSELPAAERLALQWAETQTVDIHGMTDEDFGQLRAHYSDSEVVELTFTVSFFNYFTRLVEGLGLPVEPWVLDPAAKPAAVPAWTRVSQPARVALISDEEIKATGEALAAATKPVAGNAGLGIGMANSQRAMLRVPALAAAWREFGAANSGSSLIGRDIQLQVSFAVSMANGCRYCTLHQVVGLRRIGVDATKLLAMEKDDSALTGPEKAAVVFARKITSAPATTTTADYEALRGVFQEQGALEVLMQSCNFAFMNRFTDGLHLPSEDEAITIYREVYQKDFTKKK